MICLRPPLVSLGSLLRNARKVSLPRLSGRKNTIKLTASWAVKLLHLLERPCKISIDIDSLNAARVVKSTSYSYKIFKTIPQTWLFLPSITEIWGWFYPSVKWVKLWKQNNVMINFCSDWHGFLVCLKYIFNWMRFMTGFKVFVSLVLLYQDHRD